MQQIFWILFFINIIHYLHISLIENIFLISSFITRNEEKIYLRFFFLYKNFNNVNEIFLSDNEYEKFKLYKACKIYSTFVINLAANGWLKMLLGLQITILT